MEAGRLGKSDDVIIQFDLELNSSGGSERKVIKNWKRANWERIKRGLAATAWPVTVVDKLVKENVPE